MFVTHSLKDIASEVTGCRCLAYLSLEFECVNENIVLAYLRDTHESVIT
jgi:hypothetical protein